MQSNMNVNKRLTGMKWLFWISIAFILLPIASLLLSNILSNLLDCSTAYAGAESCKIGGQFMGEAVYTMFTFGWVGFYSIPIGIVGLIVAGIIYFAHKVAKGSA